MRPKEARSKAKNNEQSMKMVIWEQDSRGIRQPRGGFDKIDGPLLNMCGPLLLNIIISE